jgi:hypothetical protein
MGYKEAFRVVDDKGQPTLVYMQISKTTFLELNQANAQRAPGFTHYGLVVENAAAAVEMFKQRGATVTATNVSAGTKAILSNITDPGPHRARRDHAGLVAPESDFELEIARRRRCRPDWR